MSEADKKDYQVGYGKPPQSTQFRAGQSGNPKGRPRGSLNMMTVIERELNSKVTVTENGRKKKVPKKEVVAKQLVNKAASGDLKATNIVLGHAREYEIAADTVATAQEGYTFRPADLATWQIAMERFGKSWSHASSKADPIATTEPPQKICSPRRRVQLLGDDEAGNSREAASPSPYVQSVKRG